MTDPANILRQVQEEFRQAMKPRVRWRWYAMRGCWIWSDEHNMSSGISGGIKTNDDSSVAGYLVNRRLA